MVVDWKSSPPVYANRQAEMALVYLAMVLACDEVFVIEARDFMYDDCRFIFEQAREMRAQKYPIDKAGQASWFKRPEVVRQMRQAKLDTFFENGQLQGEPVPAAEILEIVIGGEFGTLAHLDWYALELRKWRVRRGLRLLSLDLEKVADERDAEEGMKWLMERYDQLLKVAAPIMSGVENGA